MTQFDKKDFQQRLQKIEKFVHTLESAADPHVRANAVELMQSVMELHGAGIERMMEIVFEADGAGVEIIDRFANDDLVASLLLLYGLHPVDLEPRVRQALDKVRPYLRSHGGNVELVGVAEGMVRLKLQGSCNGCASSAMTLKLAIEEAVYEAAPDISGLEVEGVVAHPPSNLVQLGKPLVPHTTASLASDGKGWEEVKGLSPMAEGTVRMLEVSGHQILFCRLGDHHYAYSPTCPECGRAIAASVLVATTLVCSSCGERFDVLRAGRGLDKPNVHLEPFPLLVNRQDAKIALPALQQYALGGADAPSTIS